MTELLFVCDAHARGFHASDLANIRDFSQDEAPVETYKAPLYSVYVLSWADSNSRQVIAYFLGGETTWGMRKEKSEHPSISSEMTQHDTPMGKILEIHHGVEGFFSQGPKSSCSKLFTILHASTVTKHIC